MENKSLTLSIADQIAVLTLDHPPVNSLDTISLKALSSAVDQVNSNQAVKVIVVTGAGERTFSAGADLNEIARIGDPSLALTIAREGQALMNKIENLRKPVIAAINGVCLGGGLDLAMACHIRIASQSASLGQPEIKLGLIPGYGGTQRLPRIVGKAKALEMLLTGEAISAQEAHDIGLVNRVIADGAALNAALELARQIAAMGQIAIKLILESVNEGMKTSLSESLGIEARNFSEVIETQDAREGVTAFLAKRQPNFKDR